MIRPLLGALLVAAHAVAFGALAGRFAGTELTVDVQSPPASPVLTLDGRVPPALAHRVAVTTVADPPGLARRTYAVTYRGAFTRAGRPSRM